MARNRKAEKERRKERGQCLDCRDPAEPGKTLCRVHLDLNNARAKAARTAPDYPARRQAYVKQWRADRKAKGLCGECPDPAEPGQTYCAAHLKRRRLRQQEKASQGLCPKCQKREKAEGYASCVICVLRGRVYAWQQCMKQRDLAGAIDYGDD